MRVKLLVIAASMFPFAALAQTTTTCSPMSGNSVQCRTQPAGSINWGLAQTPDFFGGAMRAAEAGRAARAQQDAYEADAAYRQAQAAAREESARLANRQAQASGEINNLFMAGKCTEAVSLALSVRDFDLATVIDRTCRPRPPQ